jgi:hypothetical protein
LNIQYSFDADMYLKDVTVTTVPSRYTTGG